MEWCLSVPQSCKKTVLIEFKLGLQVVLNCGSNMHTHTHTLYIYCSKFQPVFQW